MKWFVIMIISCISLGYAQPGYKVFELDKGKLEGWERAKTTNSNATDKLPVYYVAGKYLLRIEPTNDYYTQLFNEKYELVWETNTPLMDGSSVNFTNHAKTIFHSEKYIYEMDYGLNYGSGIIKVLDITNGENRSTPFKSGTKEDNLVATANQKSNPFFADDKMFIVISKGKKTYLEVVNNSGGLLTKEINLEGSSFYSDESLYSNIGGWVNADVENNGKFLLRKLNFDSKTSDLDLETVWINSSGSVTKGEGYQVNITDRGLLDAESFSWMEGNDVNTMVIALTMGGKSEDYARVLCLYKFANKKLIETQEYKFGEDIILDEKMALGGALASITHPEKSGDELRFSIMYYKYAGAGAYWVYSQLVFSADKNLKIEYLNDPKRNSYESTIIGLVQYNNEFKEAGAVTAFYKPEFFDKCRELHEYIDSKNPKIDKNCRYVGCYFNGKYILVRDDYYTVSPTVFEFSF